MSKKGLFHHPSGVSWLTIYGEEKKLGPSFPTKQSSSHRKRRNIKKGKGFCFCFCLLQCVPHLNEDKEAHQSNRPIHLFQWIAQTMRGHPTNHAYILNSESGTHFHAKGSPLQIATLHSSPTSLPFFGVSLLWITLVK